MNTFHKPPSFFIVYAHDNRDFPRHPADARIVLEMLQWFQDAGCAVKADLAPPAEKQITHCQFCLFPYRDFPHSSVNNVIVFGSQLLGLYMKPAKFGELVKDVVAAYDNVKIPSTRQKELEDSIRNLQVKYQKNMGGDFHHVLTEIALLKVRAKYEKKPSIITCQLNGESTTALPDYLARGNDWLRTTLGIDGSKYACFLELLEKLYGSSEEGRLGPENLIRGMRGIYEKAESSLEVGKAWSDDWDFEFGNIWYGWLLNRPTFPSVDVPGIQTALDRYAKSLSAETLLREIIPIDKYSIELAVSEPSRTEKNSELAENPEPEIIRMADMFQERPLRDGGKGKPKRILIQGRPGTGKTTLCRQIFHQMKQNPWSQFEWVLWVPLGRFAQEKDLNNFLGRMYFGEDFDLAKGFQELISKQNKKDTLLILDGWDEIHGASRELNDRVNRLVEFENIIITSRFYSVQMPKVDLIIDAIGLSDQTMSLYVRNRPIGTSVMSQIQDFLNKQPAIKEAFRAPMLLDLLCTFWHELKLELPKAAQLGYIPTTTLLYRTMVTALWRKDLFALVKPPSDRENIKEISSLFLHKRVQSESQCLGNMAMKLFERSEQSMNRKSIDYIAEGNDQEENLKHEWLALNVTRTSFLHSDQFNDGYTYSFVHQTFQEFFAAQRLVEVSSTGSSCIEVSSTLSSWLRKHKYDPRFRPVFSFVAGLLSRNETDSQLESFFRLIEAEPRDLLGPAHERLVMNCLSQVQRPRIAQMRDVLERRMKDWLIFQCISQRRCHLAREAEFPDHIRKAVLEDPTLDDWYKRLILQEFWGSTKHSAAIQSLLISWPSKEGIHFELRKTLLKGYDGCPLPDGGLSYLKELGKKGPKNVRGFAIDAHQRAISGPRKDGEVTVQQKNRQRADEERADKECADRQRASKQRASQAYADMEYKARMAESSGPLQRTDLSREDIRSLCGGLDPLSPGILHRLTRLLDHSRSDVRSVAVRVLRRHGVPDSELTWLVSRLSTTNDSSKARDMIRVLCSPELPSIATGALIEALNHRDKEIVLAAEETLRHQKSLSPSNLKTLLLKGKHEDSKPFAAAELVRQRAELSPELMRSVISQIVIMPETHLESLKGRNDLPDPIIQAILKRLNGDIWPDPGMVIKLLGNQRIPSPDTLQTLAAQFRRDPHKVAAFISQHFEAAIVAALRKESPQFFIDLYHAALWISFDEPMAWTFGGDQKFCKNSVSKGVYGEIKPGRMLLFIQQAKEAMKLAPPAPRRF